ncbi:fibroblast growth factor receptor 2-like [Ptychodera flava]|uniref:fibroblast growth factor receptor 2-like n=1 Tax=Ptychodera flava TaxID=63121 RepID=UPI00396A22BA
MFSQGWQRMVRKFNIHSTIFLMCGCLSMIEISTSEILPPRKDGISSLSEEQCIYKKPEEDSSRWSNTTDKEQVRYLYFTEKQMSAGGMRVEIAEVADTATFGCPVNRNDTQPVRWMRAEEDGEFVENFKRIGNHPPKRQGDRLILDSIVMLDATDYMCIVESEHCSINFTHKLFAVEPASKPVCDKRYPQNKTVVVGSNVTMECFVSNTGPLQYTHWIKHYQPDKAASNMKILQAARAADSHQELNVFIHNLFSKMVMESIYEGDLKMTLYDVTAADTGLYSCFTAILHGSDYSTAWLVVRNNTQLETASVPTIPLEHPSAVPVKWMSKIMEIVLPLASLVIVVIGFVYVTKFFQRRRKKKRRLRMTPLPGKWSNFYRLATTSSSLHSEYDSIHGKWKPGLFSGFFNNNHTYVNPDTSKTSIDDNWEFPRNRLVLGDLLGEGAFGKVVKADAYGIIPNQEKTTVAVKMLKAHSTSADLKSLLEEMEYVKKLGKHINIVNLLGCCTLGGPLLLLFEYACNGNLRDFLRLKRQTEFYENLSADGRPGITHKELVSFAYQISRGMEYMASRKYVHRDLAARNILVDDTYVVKIADFGLARDLHYENYYKKNSHGRVPIKWMSPEALFDRVYTTKSDVWSFGVVLWEIMTLGGTPYPSVTPEAMFDFLKSGKRMACPKGCPTEIYDVMRSCWQTTPERRPDFSNLVPMLDKLVSASSTEEYLALELPSVECFATGDAEGSYPQEKKESTV